MRRKCAHTSRPAEMEHIDSTNFSGVVFAFFAAAVIMDVSILINFVFMLAFHF